MGSKVMGRVLRKEAVGKKSSVQFPPFGAPYPELGFFTDARFNG